MKKFDLLPEDLDTAHRNKNDLHGDPSRPSPELDLLGIFNSLHHVNEVWVTEDRFGRQHHHLDASQGGIRYTRDEVLKSGNKK